MARGIDRQVIFCDDRDREDLLQRLAQVVGDYRLRVYAWALMPNHLHLLVKTGEAPLERSMRSLLTGYAVTFNRRHGRVGHLFQNRYKSIVCEAERYFLELVRYIHLNPLRSGLLRHVDDLDQYAYTGHAAILSTVPRGWQCTEEVLEHFGRNRGGAAAAYRKFIGDGVLLGKRSELTGGGIVRSAGSWKAVAELRRGREEFVADERVLGSSRFVDHLLSEAASAESRSAMPVPELTYLADLVCRACGVSRAALAGAAGGRRVWDARAGLAYLWIEFFGQSGRALARAIGRSPNGVYKAAKRGRREHQFWTDLLHAGKH